MEFDIDGIFQQDAAEKDDRFWQNCPRFSRMPRKAISGSSVLNFFDKLTIRS